MTTLNVGSGADGNVTISSDKNINTDLITGGRSYADGVIYRITSLTASAAVAGSTPNGITPGDEILLIKLRGSTTEFLNVGNYEFLTVDSVVGSNIGFTTSKTKYYGSGASDDDGLSGTQLVFIQRVPNYNNITIDNSYTLSCNYWGGITGGGILSFRAAGTLTVNGSINATARGYRGSTVSDSYCGETYAGWKTQANPGAGWYGGGGPGQAAGGGSHATAGTDGAPGPGYGGPSTYGQSTLASTIFFGSAGGTGYYNEPDSQGGAGGGVILISAQTALLYGPITAKGRNSDYNGGGWTAGYCGGSGAGGSIRIKAGTLTTSASDIDARGVVGLQQFSGNKGGNGGDGINAIYYQILDGGTTTVYPTPYTEELEPSYAISGDTSENAVLYVYDPSDGSLIKSENINAGSYSVGVATSSGINVVAVPESASKNAIIYRNVTPGTV